MPSKLPAATSDIPKLPKSFPRLLEILFIPLRYPVLSPDLEFCLYVPDAITEYFPLNDELPEARVFLSPFEMISDVVVLSHFPSP